MLDFLQQVITTKEGYFCLSYSNGRPDWRELFFDWPKQKMEIIGTATELSVNNNVYFSAHLFNEKRALKSAVLPSKTIQADLDDANVYNLPVAPTVLTETSPARYQGFWILGVDEYPTPQELETLSRTLTYAIPECDRSGWPLGHRMRLPGTFNHKYEKPTEVQIVRIGQRRVDLSTLEILPEPPSIEDAEEVIEWINKPHQDLAIPPTEFILELSNQKKISSVVKHQFSHSAADRSKSLWRLYNELFSADIPRDIVYWIAYNSANNKFDGRTRDLRKDVIRAEGYMASGTNSEVNSLKQIIEHITKQTSLTKLEKLESISDIVINYLRREGTLLRGKDNNLYFTPHSSGVPIIVSTMSERFAAFITYTVGVNSSTQDFRYLVAAIRGAMFMHPNDVEIASLAYYAPSSHVIQIHSGHKNVYNITESSITTEPNGTSGDVLFTWPALSEPFTPVYEPLPDNRKWYEHLFESSLENTINLPKDQALTMIAVWTLYILIRNSLVRPILAMFGSQGAGKTMVFEVMYRLIYGKYKGLNSISTMNDFIRVVSQNPLVVFDGADTWEKWLPNELTLASSPTTTPIRRLYTDSDEIQYTRQAMVGLTAHTPKFIRADVADRLIILLLPRRTFFGEKSKILSWVSKHRNVLWGAIFKDLQKLLSTPRPTPDETPQFRLQDFAAYGLWIAKALGRDELFLKAIDSIKRSQSNAVLEGDAVLVNAISRMVSMPKHHNKAMTSSELFNILSELVPDPKMFQRIYKNGIVLGRSLVLLAESLKTVFDIIIEHDQITGVRRYTFKAKSVIDNEGENGQD